MNIVLGITGSVSAYKTPWLVRDLQRAGHTVRVVTTVSATEFVAPLALEATSRHPVVTDAFAADIQERGSWHVHLAQWADVMLVAPCSASTLAKLATAMCDNAVVLVACSLPKTTPLIVAPAMDADMWQLPATQRNVERLSADGMVVLQPEHGELSSGLIGSGRLPELHAIVDVVNQHDITSNNRQRPTDAGLVNDIPAHDQDQSSIPEYTKDQPRAVHVVITAGPTHEPIDAVRSIVNHSTGTMGFALARAAADRGALVTLITGPVNLPTPRGVQRIDVTTAQEMYHSVQQHRSADLFVMAAAVADFTPAQPQDTKIKKDTVGSTGLTLQLVPTKDILASVGANKLPHQVVVGFALETENVVEYAQRKLVAKNADMIVANQAGIEHSGFGPGMNTITLVTADSIAPYPPMPKVACAEVVVDAAFAMLQQKTHADSSSRPTS